MKLTRYFIDHPVVSLVINGMIVLLGLLCFYSLSVREYPQVKFPTITVQANYPNASPELVESSVTHILEDRLAGLEGLESMTSESKQGSCSIELNFRVGTSMDQSLINVRDGIGLARAMLPKEVKDPVVERRTKSDGPPFMAISLQSSSLDFGALTHYANLNLKNGFRSLKGVASADVWGQPYTYKITLDPKKMYTFGVNGDEVFDALERGNVSLPVGKFQNEIPTLLNAELKTIEDYENLLIKEKDFTDPKNKKHPVLLKSIGTVSLQTDEEQFRVRINGSPGLCLGIQRTSDANPLEVSTLVQAHVAELRKSLPEGIKMEVIVDQADFIRASLKNIKSSILEAILFVLAIVFLFLRNFRATLIPLVTIPISLIGSFLFLKLFGFSLNIMTLLAMVLAVGLVVDDAIVVLENISRHLENGLSPLEASLKGAKEIGFAIVAMTLTLTSVYAPIAFIQGTIGQLFIEFAVALAGSVLISGLVALTLSPLMCAHILKNNPKQWWPGVDGVLTHISETYQTLLEKVISYEKTALCVGLSFLAGTGLLIHLLPSEMAPKEDRGLVGVFVPLIPGKDINTLEEKTIAVEKIVKDLPEGKGSLTFVGEWGGSVVLPLKPLSQRKRTASEIVNGMEPEMMSFPSVDAWPWSWDSGLPGMDDAMGGSELSMVISTPHSYRDLFDQIEKVRQEVEKANICKSIRHNLRLDVLGYAIDLDNNLLSELNLTQRQVSKMIEIFFSGDQSLTFQKEGLLYAITLQGGINPWTLNELYLTNREGKRISLGAVAKMTPKAQPKSLFHYNQMRSATLTADLRPGEKMETVMPKLLHAVEKTLGPAYKKNWGGAAKGYTESSMTMAILFLLALIFIYAILSIQFESFVDPLIVLCTVPLACAGALLVVWLCGQSMNIYTQVGLITLIGLITKHGILIVEFSNQLVEEGLSLLEAVQKASLLRLRPILMTTGAMIFGSIPLVISQEAGAESRHVIGAVLLGGLGLGTLFTLFILPIVCYGVKKRLGAV